MHSINITPLTDVLLVLLITFLLSASSFQELSTEVQLPQLLELKEVAEKMTRVEIDLSGQVLWPEAELAAVSREEAFKTLRAKSEHHVLALAAHRDLTYERLYPLMLDARQSGWEQIVILTEDVP